MDPTFKSRLLARRGTQYGGLASSYGGFSGSIFRQSTTRTFSIRLWETGSGRSLAVGSADSFEKAKFELVRLFEVCESA